MTVHDLRVFSAIFCLPRLRLTVTTDAPMKRGRPPSSSLSADIIICCPLRCTGGHNLQDRICKSCDSPLGFTCVPCGRFLSLSNRYKGHKCVPLLSTKETLLSPLSISKKTFLMVLRPGDSLAVVPLRMLRALPNEFVKKHTERNSIGETLTEDYTLVMFQLHQMGHTVQFVSRAEWMRMLYSSDFTAWREKLGHVDVVIDGYWPYECAATHLKARHHLEQLRVIVPGLRICPTPADTLFAAHKSHYHSFLERSFEKRVVIPSTYLPPAPSLEAVATALAELAARADIGRGVVLKRGLSGSAREVYFFESQAPTLLKKRIHGTLHRADATKVPTMFLLQPHLAEFSEHHELKLYFDFSGNLLHAFANMFLQKTAPSKGSKENADIEVLELRRDDAPLWRAHEVDAALLVAQEVRQAILRVAPSLSPLMRIDLIRTKEWGFLVNEVEHFGDTWLQLQRSTSASILPRIAASVESWSQVRSHA